VWNLRGELPGGAAAAGAGRGGRGGGRGNLAPLVSPGRYRATLGRMVGDLVTPIGAPQSFAVYQVPQ
jgi:hypothetical protein